MKRILDTGKRPGLTVHGEILPTFYQEWSGRDGWLENDRRHGMTRSDKPGRDRRPAGGNRP